MQVPYMFAESEEYLYGYKRQFLFNELLLSSALETEHL